MAILNAAEPVLANLLQDRIAIKEIHVVNALQIGMPGVVNMAAGEVVQQALTAFFGA